jgi:hypothetical protein
MNYSDSDIIVNEWAELKQTSDGKWKQIWDILLKEPIVEATNLKDISKELSHEDFDVLLNIKQGKYLTVFVTLSNRDTNLYSHDYTVLTTHKMFEDIERLLGTIDTIQGQKMEDRWSPYKRKNISENS